MNAQRSISILPTMPDVWCCVPPPERITPRAPPSPRSIPIAFRGENFSSLIITDMTSTTTGPNVDIIDPSIGDVIERKTMSIPLRSRAISSAAQTIPII